MSAKRRVRNARGRALPCCWDDCWQDGDERHALSEPHEEPAWPGQRRVWLFCSPRHREYWRASYRHGHGHLPSGARGLLGPLGLPIR